MASDLLFPRGQAARFVFAGAALVLVSSGGSASAAISATAGAGTAIPNDESDGAGGRINIDQGTPGLLPPGTYLASQFRFDSLIAGDVTPFLATGGPNNYTAIAVGAPQAVLAGQDQVVSFGGSAVFTLVAPTTVYAGIASNTQNPIALDNGTDANTDHEGGGQAATSYLITLGGAVPPDGSFSNANLGRTYAFAVDIDTNVPEPAGLGLLAIAGAALLRRRR